MKSIINILFLVFSSLFISSCSLSEIIMGNILGSASDGISAIYLSENDPNLEIRDFAKKLYKHFKIIGN